MGLGKDEEEDIKIHNHHNHNKVVDEGDGRGSKFFGSVSCSICLDVVTDNGDRSLAKLLCGHQFHLGNFHLSLSLSQGMQIRWNFTILLV